MKKNKKIFLLAIIILVISFSFVIYKNKKDINNILSSKNYSYLPTEAKEYLKGVYEETGQIMLTEKNKKENTPYLNPEYVKYLESGKKSEYGYVPEEVIVEHSYKNDIILEKQGTEKITTTESTPYYNLRDDGYITNIYDQGSEGLCWAFSSSTSLESHLALKSNKQTMLTFSEKQIDYATAIKGTLDIGNNPYINNYATVLGNTLNEGGNMIRFINSTAIGISPVECKGNCSNGANYNKDNNITDNKYWKHDYSVNSPLSPYEILNFDNTKYTVNGTLFFNSLVNQSKDEVDALVKILKNQIVNNGSLYVSVGAYTNLSVEYLPANGEKTLNSNGKNIIYYIPYGWNPENALNHAMSIIGWDDEYEHNICLNKTAFEIKDAIKKSDGSYSCSNTNATLHTIKGAWILQNSWGTDKEEYVYLPYNTMKSTYSSITDVSEIDFDNSYRADTYFRTTIDKGETKEVINKIKLYISTYNQTIKVYYDESDNNIIINDGSKSSNGRLLTTLKTTHPGLYTIDLLDKAIVLDENISRATFSFDTNDTDYYYYASIHTNNVEEEKYIDISQISKVHEEILAKCNLNDNKCISTPQQISFDDNNVFNIYGITRNLTSDDNLTFKVLNSNKEDVTNLFHFFRNFSVSNYVNALISYNDDDVELDNYTIEVYYNETKYDELEWKLEKHNNLISGIGTEQNPYKIRTVQDLNDIRNHTTTNEDVSDVIYGYYVLENDLDLTYDTQDKNGSLYNDGAGWEPIYKFAGNFDGNNHTITGLYIKRTSSRNIGLFGTVFGFDNYIRNIILKNVNINGNMRVGTLIGGIYESNAIDIHDIAVMNGNVYASNQIAGGLIGYLESKKDSDYNFYNLFNNSDVFAPGLTGGIIGFETADSNYGNNSNINISILDTANYGNVSGKEDSNENTSVGGIISWIKFSNNLNFRNIITVGKYSGWNQKDLGDIFGGILEYNSINIRNIYYLNNLYGTAKDFSVVTTNKITNNTKVVFKDILTNDAINTFDHKDDWIYPEIDGIKRIPMLKSMVKYFDFTEKIEDFDLGINSSINIKDLIKPNIDAAKNIEYTYDDEYLSINSSGLITAKKIGTTTIHISSLYDGYEDDIQVNIKETATITYDSNNNYDKRQNTQYVILNETFTLDKNIFSYKGHTFKNWNTLADGTGTTYDDKHTIDKGIKEDLQLYAQWTPMKYTISFNPNGAPGEVYDWIIEYPKSGNINFGRDNLYTKENYILDSWNTKADGTGTKYLTNSTDYSVKFDDISFDNNNKIILYAIWKINEYTVTFDANSGTGTMLNQTIQYNVSTKLNKNTFTKSGYTFTGWNTKTDGTGETYTDEQTISIKENLTLYATWKQNGPEYEFKKYTIDEINKYIDLIEVNTTVDDFKKNIELNTGFTVDVDYKTINGKNLLYTGGKTKIYKDDELYIEYTNIIRGDVNGNATIDIIDYIRIMKDIMDITKLTGEYIKAADVNQNNTVDIIDYIRIMKMIMEEN